MKQGYRIISIEAADIYRQEQENGVSVGYVMPEKKSDVFKFYCVHNTTVSAAPAAIPKINSASDMQSVSFL